LVQTDWAFPDAAIATAGGVAVETRLIASLQNNMATFFYADTSTHKKIGKTQLLNFTD
jgi:hypothetical protein